MEMRSPSPIAANSFVAACRESMASCVERLRSSKNSVTNLCGSSVAFSGAPSEVGSGESSFTVGTWEAEVSIEKLEMIWGLRSSTSWKSSFFRLETTLPSLSRTTTRTRTKLTRTLNVAGASCETISSLGALASGLGAFGDVSACGA